MYGMADVVFEKDEELERMRNMLEDVINALDLSEEQVQHHGPLGTPPAELVRLVLAEKDKKIALLKAGMTEINVGGQ